MGKKRVLHIGNIANNAYLNAKLLNENGFVNDVLCCDYYHIMGCPEWEDADFNVSQIDNADKPNWKKIQTDGFRRPNWFVQGPTYFCLKYLKTRNHGKGAPSFLLRRFWGIQAYIFLKYILRNWNRGKIAISYFLQRIGVISSSLLKYKKEKKYRATRPSLWLWVLWKIQRVILGNIIYPLFSLMQKVIHSLAPRTEMENANTLTKLFARCFPDRKDSLTLPDILPYLTHIKLWREVLSFYDYVIGYGLHGCWPLLTNQHPYLAYEHGTIRQLPFLPDAQGRLCALTYRMADLSLITNADNNQAADTLGLYPYAFMPHPVNEWMPEIEQCRTLHEELLASLNADFIVFHPSRQHWDETRDPSLEKGNDIFIRGLARFIQECNPRGAAVFVDWGKMVNKTQRLLEELKIAQRVHWIPPQHNHAMVRYMKACDLLADQFYLGAFGSTMPKALLHETPAMLYLDEERHRWCFPEMPPVINASTPEEVFTGMRRLYEDKSYREALVRDGKSWYDRYHSNRVIAETFLRLFKTIPQPSRHGTLLT